MRPTFRSGWVGEKIGHWVSKVETRPKLTLIALLSLFIVACFVVVKYSKINSDLNSLIQPSSELGWYSDNENYKTQFPLDEQTAVLVVSGNQSHEVSEVTRALSEALRGTEEFEFVFAPGVSEFVNSKKLYYLSTTDFELWQQALQFNFGAILRLSDEASVANSLYILADLMAVNARVPLPSPLHDIAEYLSGGQVLEVKNFDIYPKLVDRNQQLFTEVIVIKGMQFHDEQLPNDKILKQIRSVINHVNLPDLVSVKITGEVALANEEISSALDGVERASLISIVLLTLILGFGLRSWRLIGSVFLLLLMGLIMTMALAVVTVGSYNTLSLLFIVMFFGLGVDFAVHYLLMVKETRIQFDHNHKNAEEKNQSPAVIAAEKIGPALALCMLTTAVAFLSFVPTAYAGMAELGIISAGGMIVAFILTITLLPALSVLGRFKGMVDIANRKVNLPELRLPARYILTLVLALSFVAVYFAKDTDFDYSVLAMRDKNTEAMTALFNLQAQHLATEYGISILVQDTSEALELKKELMKLAVVGDVILPQTVVPLFQAKRHTDMFALKQLYESIDIAVPAEEQGIAEALRYFNAAQVKFSTKDKALAKHISANLAGWISRENVLNDVDESLRRHLNSEVSSLKQLLSAAPFSLEQLPSEIKRRIVSTNGTLLMTVLPNKPLLDRRTSDEFITAVARIAPNIAGRAVVEWGIGDVVVNAFKRAAILSFSLIFFILIIYFQRLDLAILVLTPIFLALLFTLALCNMFGVSLNMANILVVPLIFGLGVDTGIHVVHRYNLSSLISENGFGSTNKAVLISGLTTIATFFSLSFSLHKGAASIGMLLTLAITLLLLMTFFVLPALLQVLKIREKSA